ncbi:carbohydrate-binding module family 50 protein [Trametes coccinea BRFM310]|uniref:Carbohydrate-binding module family 50 protein n=1 Tax=Trametes coccinea (strain BRFM310) TaxID=1353009 RepID=A0A1Y2IHJ0_TRAC3|nr:carbohydrate-binding module family 50 protein [Trametes coccinea BRFM310]
MQTSTGLGTYASPNGYADDETTDDLLSVWASTPGPSSSSLRHAAIGESLSLSSSSSFSSAVRRNETTPAKRRHAGSDAATRRGRTDHDPWAVNGDPGEGGRAAHVRARTLDGEGSASPWRGVGRSTSTSHHPLKTRNGSASMAHETRPSMKRMLCHNDAMVVASDSDPIDDDESARHRRSVSQDREMLVVVHQVQPTDSLPGVSLKYGISLAELRRANQLWPSDPIHLRETLYIPVDKARNVRHLRSIELRNTEDTANQASIHSNDVDAVVRNDHVSSQSTPSQAQEQQYTLRRVPASQLAFFPPPSNHPSPSQPSTSSTANPLGSRTLPARKPASNRPPIPGFPRARQDAPLQNVIDLFSTSLHVTANHLRAYAQSQSSLFVGPGPIKQSQSLASRLSIDSNSASATASSEEGDWEHEMESLGSGGARRTRSRQSLGESSRTQAIRVGKERDRATLRARKRRSASPEERESVELDSAPFLSTSSPGASVTTNGIPPALHSPPSKHRRNSSSRSQNPSHSRLGSNGTNAAYRKVVPYVAVEDDDAGGAWGQSPPLGAVRTAQLEPSPSMQLPTLQK